MTPISLLRLPLVVRMPTGPIRQSWSSARLNHTPSGQWRELTTSSVTAWLVQLGANTVYVVPRSAWKNGCVDSFSSKLPDEMQDREFCYRPQFPQMQTAW